MAEQAKQGLSLSDLNLTKKCEEGYEFEYINENGKQTGFFLTVIGAHAQEVQKWANSKLNIRRRQDAITAKRGKDIDVRDIEDDIEFGTEFMSIRIKAWRGIDEPCTPQNALLLCQTNALIVEQVKEASENLGNFGKSK